RKVEDDLPSLDWDEALSRDDVDAFVICTENDTHEEYARKTLEHGKHVLVDFPLSLTAQSGKELFNLADSKGLVCHVEDIALLLESHQDFKQSIKAKTVPLLEGTIRLDARFSCEWISDLSRAGFPSFSDISNLECLHDLFGELSLQEAHFVHETDLISLTCKFSTSDNRWVSFFSIFLLP
ncbi:biliverdin reductase A-like, partial [Oculina patagonica]